MRIGIEASTLCTATPTGIGRYAYQLIEAQANLLSNSNEDTLRLFYSLSRAFKFSLFPKNFTADIQKYYKNLWPIDARVDVIHGLDNCLPNWKGVKRIITIHDLFLLINESNEISPQDFRKKKRAELEKVLSYADGVIAVSNNTKNDVIRLFDYPPEKIFVTHLGVDKCYGPKSNDLISKVRKKHDLKSDYLLFVGSISGRKNTKRLVQAYSEWLKKTQSDLNLVLAGNISYKGEATVELIQKLNLENRVKIINFVKEDELCVLYADARAMLFPTLYEGFGLPILEAFASETPVLTSNTGSGPEIASTHATLVDPHKIDSIVEGIDKVLMIDQAAIKKAREYALTFTWEKCAQMTLDAYRKT